MAKVLNDKIWYRHGIMTTIHAIPMTRIHWMLPIPKETCAAQGPLPLISFLTVRGSESDRVGITELKGKLMEAPNGFLP
jgi:hypothetical protein